MHTTLRLSFTFILLLFLANPLTALIEEDQDLVINAVASLVYHIGELEEDMHTYIEGKSADDLSAIEFSETDAAALWDRISIAIHNKLIDENIMGSDNLYSAYMNYYKAKEAINNQEFKEAKTQLTLSFKCLSSVWEKLIDLPQIAPLPFVNKSSYQVDVAFDDNPYIEKKIKKEMRPYLIPSNHSMKKCLDQIFSQRVTLNESTFKQAGFIAKGEQRPRSFIVVAAHATLPNYLLKLYLDSELRCKYHKPSWKWLVQRCEGAKKIRSIIKDKGIKHFTVAEKWIYPLPASPSPPQDPRYTRHLAVLLVSDMHLVNDHLNVYAWSHYITKEHLKELYTIISRAKGSSYRPDNIAYTEQETFAFIDTEYPTKGPDYKRIRPYLNPDMRYYWDELIKKGGK